MRTRSRAFVIDTDEMSLKGAAETLDVLVDAHLMTLAKEHPNMVEVKSVQVIPARQTSITYSDNREYSSTETGFILVVVFTEKLV